MIHSVSQIKLWEIKQILVIFFSIARTISLCGHKLGCILAPFALFWDSITWIFQMRIVYLYWTFLCIGFSHSCTAIWYENGINKQSKLFKRLKISGFTVLFDGFINEMAPGYLNSTGQVVSFWISSFTCSMSCFKILWNVIVECINIHTCKHFYGRYLDLSGIV